MGKFEILPKFWKINIRYYCIDLLWGQKLYQELRFALVEMDGVRSILASTLKYEQKGYTNFSKYSVGKIPKAIAQIA